MYAIKRILISLSLYLIYELLHQLSNLLALKITKIKYMRI